MPNVTIASSPDGGETYDSTGRLALSSYQKGAGSDRFGEVVRVDLSQKYAKGAVAWRFPSGGYDGNGNPVGAMETVVWMVAHWGANDMLSNHKHWSIETPAADGTLRTRLSVEFGDRAVDNGIAGFDKGLIMTDSADFVVRSGGPVLRVAASAGQSKEIEFSNDARGAATARRWKIRANSASETGSNAGTDFAIGRHDDSGTALDSPFVIKRSNGRVAMAQGIDGALKLSNVTTPPSTGPALYVEGGALKFIGGSGTVTVLASA